MSEDVSNLKQTIIQIIMSKPYLSAAQLDQIIEPLHISRQEFVRQTNESLQPLGLILRNIISDYDDVEYYGVCEIYEDINGKESLGIRAEIVQLFYKYLDMLINSPPNTEVDTSVGKILDLAPEGLTSVAAQDGLRILQDYGYVETINNKVRIGPRGILEFRPKFQKTTDSEETNLKQCQICLDFILAGKKCPQCTCCMHKRCYEQYSAANPNSIQCPVCQCKDPFVDFGL